MKEYTLEDIKPWIIFSGLMGSHAYGTVLPTSDKDIRGVFVQPLEDILKYGYVEQVSDETNDITYYELKRFLDLLKTNNPNIVEIVFCPEDCVLFKTPEWDLIVQNKDRFLSKLCKLTFANYAINQIKKAKGYNKKINWEESEMKRKTVLNFCYVLFNGGSKSFKDWLEYKKQIGAFDKNWDQRYFGLANIDHAHDIYAMYFLGNQENFPSEISGIVSNEETANNVQLTSIPKGLGSPQAYLSFNKDGYSTHCTKYKEYQDWLKNRNEDRFKLNKEHGKNYDSKNMCHTFRLLNVALEIANTGTLQVRRSEKEIEKLMKIRKGEYEYDNLLNDSTILMDKLDESYENSILPEKVDVEFVNSLLLQVRKQYCKI